MIYPAVHDLPCCLLITLTCRSCGKGRGSVGPLERGWGTWHGVTGWERPASWGADCGRFRDCGHFRSSCDKAVEQHRHTPPASVSPRPAWRRSCDNKVPCLAQKTEFIAVPFDGWTWQIIDRGWLLGHSRLLFIPLTEDCTGL